MRQTLLVAMTVAALTLAGHAQSPVQSPAQSEQKALPDAPEQPRRGMYGDGMGGRPGRYGFQRPVQEPTPDEWADVSLFMKEHSPKRWRSYQSAPEGQQSRLRSPIYVAWKTLERMERDDPDMFELRLKRLPIEDDIFGLVTDIKKNGEKSEELRKQLREKVAAFIDLRMQERKLRVQRLEIALAAERAALAEGETRREGLIDARTREVVSQGPRALLGDPEPPQRRGEQDGSRRDAVSEEALPRRR